MSKILFYKRLLTLTAFALSLWGNVYLLTHPAPLVGAVLLLVMLGFVYAYTWYVARHAARVFQAQLERMSGEQFTDIINMLKK